MLLRCPQCQTENPFGATTCHHCQAALVVICPQCHTPLPLGFAFCGSCGARLTPLPTGLSAAELEHWRRYLPPELMEALRVEPTATVLASSAAHLARLINAVGSHLPSDVFAAVERTPEPGQVQGAWVQGTLLFADISGFTAMSERLSFIGREGAEEITLIINRYFHHMLQLLRQNGGRLVKFGGDALLALFTGPQNADYAVQAALQMQAAMPDFAAVNTSQGVFPLRMKVGLKQGRFFAAHLGSHHGMEFALLGADVPQAAQHEQLAQAGQIVTDAATHAALTSPVVATPHPTTPAIWLIERAASPEGHAQALPTLSLPTLLGYAPEPTLPSLRTAIKLLDALERYLPAGFLPRLLDNPNVLNVEGEHRLVAVLFANILGLNQVVEAFGAGQEAVLVRALNYYFEAMQTIIQRYGGVINKLDLHHHGNKLMAIFGAPVAHEDDVERAAHVALEMQAALADLNAAWAITPPPPTGAWPQLQQSIGITYGYVFAGYVGTSWRREYTVMGDEANLAARLMAAHLEDTTQPILVSARVQREIAAAFELTPHGELTLKGKTKPVLVFQLTGVRARKANHEAAAAARPLFGRVTETQHLAQKTDLLFAGRGQIVSVIGEVGLGKTRLLAEAQRLFLEHPFNRALALSHAERTPRWFTVECVSYMETASYWPWRALLLQWLEVHPEADQAFIGQQLRASLHRWLPAEEAQAHWPYLAHFLGVLVDYAQHSKLRVLEAEALQNRTFMAITALLEACALAAPQPLVLMLDDLQWIDAASRVLLERLLNLVNRLPLLFLLAYTPERDKPCWQVREKIARDYAHCASELLLQPLPAEACAQMLAARSDTATWPAALHAWVLSRTEGNPLFLEELAQAVQENPALSRASEGEQPLPAAAHQLLPDTLQELMMARLDRLDPLSREVAQTAAVIGRVFPYAILAELQAEQAPGKLDEALLRLQRGGLIEETQRLPQRLYRFRHGLMREVYYASLLARAARRCHRQIAAYLERRHQPDDESDLDALAQHAFLGQDWALALRYQLAAGQRAEALFANASAINYYLKALACVAQLPAAEVLPQRQLLHTALGDLLTTTGQYESAHFHLEQALAYTENQAAPEVQAKVCRLMAHWHEVKSEYAEALEWTQRGLALVGDPPRAETVQLQLQAGLVHLRRGERDVALSDAHLALGLAQKLEAPALLGRANNLVGLLLSRRGQPSAIEYFQRAAPLYEQVGDLLGQANTQNLLAMAQALSGQWSLADVHFRRARLLFEQLDDGYHRAFVDNNLGNLALNQGRLDEAVTFYQEALRTLAHLGVAPYAQGTAHMNWGAALIYRGDLAAAHAHLRESEKLFQAAQARDFWPELHRRWAEAALAAGDLTEAAQRGTEALRWARELRIQVEQGCALRVLGETALTQKKGMEAVQLLAQSQTLLEAAGERYELARTQLALARARLAVQQRTEALALLAACEQTFVQLEAQLDLQVVRTLRAALPEALSETV